MPKRMHRAKGIQRSHTMSCSGMRSGMRTDACNDLGADRAINCVQAPITDQEVRGEFDNRSNRNDRIRSKATTFWVATSATLFLLVLRAQGPKNKQQTLDTLVGTRCRLACDNTVAARTCCQPKNDQHDRNTA